MKLGDKILELAKMRNLDLEDVAKLAKIPHGTIRSYTRAAQRRIPPLKEALKLARALGVPLDWLADDSAGMASVGGTPSDPWVPGMDWLDVYDAIAFYEAGKLMLELEDLLEKHRGMKNMAPSQRAKVMLDEVIPRFVRAMALVNRIPDPRNSRFRSLLNLDFLLNLWGQSCGGAEILHHEIKPPRRRNT